MAGRGEVAGFVYWLLPFGPLCLCPWVKSVKGKRVEILAVPRKAKILPGP